MKTKKCSKCGKRYPATKKYFRKKRSAKVGFSSWCKACDRKHSNEYYAAHKGKYKYSHESYIMNRVRILTAHKKYQKKHRCEIAKKAKVYRKKNKKAISKCISAYHIRMRQRSDAEILIPNKKKCNVCHRIRPQKDFHRNRCNKDGLDGKCKCCCKKYAKTYYLKNKEKMQQQNHSGLHKKRRNTREKNRRKEDLNYKILINLRNRLAYAVKSQKAKKCDSTIRLVGCSINKLRRHLERQFTNKMSWDNYGRRGWTTDHIKPCAAFDLTKPKEQRKCFNYRNLQPLWWPDNLKKTSRYKGTLYRKKSRKKRS